MPKQKPAEVHSVEQALKIIEKEFGRGKAITADRLYQTKFSRIPSGSLALDMSMGGGYAVGHAHILWGDYSSGKTTLAYRAAASFQSYFPEQMPIYVAGEQFDPANAKANGVNLAKLVLVLPEYGEEAFDMAEVLTRSGSASLLVIDSVDSLITKAELEGSMEDMQRGAGPRMLNKALRKLFSVMKPVADENGLVRYESGLTAIFISQMRVSQSPFGNPEIFGGGKGFGHANSIIEHLQPASKANVLRDEDHGNHPCGLRIRAENKKNKTYPPYLMATCEYYYNGITVENKGIKRRFKHGDIDHAKELVELLLNEGLLQEAKGGLVYKDKRYSTHSFCAMLDSKPEVFRTLATVLCKNCKPRVSKRVAMYYSGVIRKRLQRNTSARNK